MSVKGPRTWTSLWGFGMAVLTLLACSSDQGAATSELFGPRSDAPECTVDLPCADGFICLLARCYKACAADQECASPREVCARSGSERGACVVQEAELPADPCDTLLCFGTMPACHSLAGRCVACTEDSHCAAEAPICDRGRGQCVERASGSCAPCSADRDCGDGPQDTCLSLPQTGERVCLQAGCSRGGAAACPGGFECLPSVDACVPRRGSCTAHRAAGLGRSCEGAKDCSPISVAGDSPFAGTCFEKTCAFPCVATPDCPDDRVCAQPVCQSVAGAPDAGADADASEG